MKYVKNSLFRNQNIVGCIVSQNIAFRMSEKLINLSNPKFDNFFCLTKPH